MEESGTYKNSAKSRDQEMTETEYYIQGAMAFDPKQEPECPHPQDGDGWIGWNNGWHDANASFKAAVIEALTSERLATFSSISSTDMDNQARCGERLRAEFMEVK